MPGPRRTPPAEEAALPAAHPYPPAAEPLAADRSARPNAHPTERPGSPNAHPTEPGQAHGGNQRTFRPAPAHRPETAGVAEAPTPRPLPANPPLPGLQLQPMVHVDDMASAVDFYEKLGGEVNHGDRDGEWVLMQVGTAQIGLVTRPPDASRGESTVELNFTATMPLARLERMLRERGVTVVEVATDRDLGTRLHLETPEGMPIKIHQVEPDLMV
jgi:predicted enzyme related to lactoylglutathione lyase